MKKLVILGTCILCYLLVVLVVLHVKRSIINQSHSSHGLIVELE